MRKQSVSVHRSRASLSVPTSACDTTSDGIHVYAQGTSMMEDKGQTFFMISTLILVGKYSGVC